MSNGIRFVSTVLLPGVIAMGSPGLSLAATSATVCEDPRPQACTMDYTPVCATLADDSVKTYSNGCSACADASVKSWVADACPE